MAEIASRIEDLEDKADFHEERIGRIESTLGDAVQRIAEHAALHTQHAMMITAAQSIALEALSKTNETRDAQAQLTKEALDNIASEGMIRSEGIQSLRSEVSALQNNDIIQNNALATIVTQGKSTKGAVDTIADSLTAWHKHPAFKIMFYVGTAIWGAVTAYLAAHSK